MNYDTVLYSEGEKLSQLIPSLVVNVYNRHDLLKYFDRYNINSSSNSIIKFTIKHLELCLGIGQKPIPEAFNYISDSLKDDEDNLTLFTDFLKYRDMKCNEK